MACNCPPKRKRTYYANIQLFAEAKEGIPGGASPSLTLREVIVCTECGKAEFSISESERRWFSAA